MTNLSCHVQKERPFLLMMYAIFIEGADSIDGDLCSLT
jgi:hypothetical protein